MTVSFGGRSRDLHRRLNGMGDELREWSDIHINAVAIQRRQIRVTILNADNGPRICTSRCAAAVETSCCLVKMSLIRASSQVSR
jgi:hypothetical protein